MMKFLCRFALILLEIAILRLVIVDWFGCPLELAAFIIACVALASK